jgi:hypothetical protein
MTKNLISGVAYHDWYLSQIMTPYPGYAAEPGTPAGVALAVDGGMAGLRLGPGT